MAHVVHRIVLGGTEYGVLKVVNHLDRRRFLPFLVSMTGSFAGARSHVATDVPVLELGKRQGPDPGAVLRLARWLRANRIHVVHSHNWSTYAYAVAAARIAGVAAVVHGEHGRETEQNRVTRRRRLLERLLLAGTDHFTAVSQEICERIQRDWGIPAERLTHIPNGVDLSRFGVARDEAALRTALGIGLAERLIGTVANLRPIKDLPTLVRAFVAVHRRVPEARLVVVGFDRDHQSRTSMAAVVPDWERVKDAIYFMGHRADVSQILPILEVYVNTSLYEGMSNTILEAMACRRPVVATRVGGNPELVIEGETGWLIPARDSEAAAARILELLGDPIQAAQMGERGRERVVRHHSFAAMIESNARVYETVASRSGAASRGAQEPDPCAASQA